MKYKVGDLICHTVQDMFGSRLFISYIKTIDGLSHYTVDVLPQDKIKHTATTFWYVHESWVKD